MQSTNEQTTLVISKSIILCVRYSEFLMGSINPILHGHGPFYLLVIFGLDFVSRIFIKTFQNFFGGESWHQLSYFDTLFNLLRLTKVAPWWRQRWAFSFFQSSCKIGLKLFSFYGPSFSNSVKMVLKLRKVKYLVLIRWYCMYPVLLTDRELE